MAIGASAERSGGPVTAALGALGAVVLMSILAACVTRTGAPPAGRAHPAHPVPSPHRGQPFDVIPGDSSLVVLVYRAGPLAALGHDHIIACRCMTGSLYLPGNPLQGSFDLRIAVNQLTVDDPKLRAAERSADFPPEVSRSARQGTRHNMLGAALLDAARYPDIVLRAEDLRPSPQGKPADVIADVLIETRGHAGSVAVPVHYDIRADRIVASGRFSLRQTSLGLTPFSAMAGALRVRDAMTVRFRLVASRREPRP